MTTASKIRVFSVDDHPLMREGIAAIVNGEPDMVLVGQAEDGRDAIHQFRQHRPDVTLMDLRLPDISGIEALITIRSEFPTARIVMLTTFVGDAEIARALAAGAVGYVLKSMPPGELARIIRRVSAGKKHIPDEIAARLAEHMGDEPLTDRERSVLQHVASGNSNRKIGATLFIAEDTVKTHLKHIMQKLDAIDRTQAVAIAVKRGIFHL
jgi:DNA-binding NarL/FixJ family response regulator